MKSHFQIALLVSTLAVTPAVAQQANDHAAHHPADAAQPAENLADGEVRKVDKEAGKITLKHGDLPGLGMPPMTMVFRVSDPKFLDQVKVGDKIRFAAEQKSGQLTVTRIEPAQ